MTVLAAWATLLARLSGQLDLVVGTPVANRGRPEIERLIGLFVNTLAVRLDLSGSPSVSEMLEHTKSQVLAALQHQDIPFEQVVELANPVRSLSHNPVFQVMFAWQNMRKSYLEVGKPEFKLLRFTRTQRSKFDCTLFLNEAGSIITGGVEYATSLFEPATIERYLGYFRNLLEAMVADETQIVDQLPMLDDAERRQLLYGWNDTKSDYPSDKCVHQLFEEQVARTPDAVAVVFEDKSLSYGELNRRSNRLAHYLRELGVKPDDRIALCIEPSLEMTVGLLGVLKAGGSYVPLDPAYPPERLRFIIEDSAPLAVLTQNHLSALLADIGSAVRAIDLNSTVAPWARCAEHNPDVAPGELTSRHLAYVIYTSGSTGTPKGVAVEHRGVVNYLYWALRAYTPLNSVVSTSLTFDATVTSLYVPWLRGGSTQLIARGKEIDDLEQRIMQLPECGIVKITPAHLDILGRRLLSRKAKVFVNTFVVGGDMLLESTVNLWQRLEGDVRLVNEYGPTETVVGCIAYHIPQNTILRSAIPIGRPISNARIYILDGRGNPVPVGVCGELYVGGAGVSRGYLNRSELTAERFMPDPFSTEAGARMYRTGDLGRWLSDGNIEFLGRNDFQVKISGFRVELGEIESRLMEHAGVGKAVVIAREDGSGDKRLVAYYTSRVADDSDADTLGPVELRSHLSGVLPEYMVPAAYVRIESLPLTPNGKLDRKALPVPETDAFSISGYEPPEGEIETVLAAIWAKALSVSRVGRYDNFFALGGTSLLVVRVVSRIQHDLNIEVAVSDLLTNPTLAAFASNITGERSHEAHSKPLALDKEAFLDTAIQTCSEFQWEPSPKRIFLTGGSGFLGSHLLRDLLKNTNAIIYCLIRCSSATAGLTTLINRLRQYYVLDEVQTNRLFAVPGDLSRPLFGLTEAQFHLLAESLDVIYHNGASVNVVYSYEALKAVNVLGTQEVLRLASCAKVKSVHFVSTMSVFPSLFTKEHNCDHTDDTLLTTWQHLLNGYAQTKWVAEKLIKTGGSRGIPFAIYRPSFISGSTQNGASNPIDLLSSFIDACFDLGCVPDVDISINMLPVDYVSECIIAASLRQDTLGQCVNLTHKRCTTLRSVCRCLKSMDIIPIKEVSYRSWFHQCIANESTSGLAALLPAPSDQVYTQRLASSDKSGMDLRSMLQVTQPDGIVLPEITDALIEKYILWRYRNRCKFPTVQSKSWSE
jgi:amino acid adenylation domain-containing protein/thioester reductase-like protein